MFQRSGLVRPNVPEDRWQHVTVLSSAPTVTAGRIPGRCAEGEQEGGGDPRDLGHGGRGLTHREDGGTPRSLADVQFVAWKGKRGRQRGLRHEGVPAQEHNRGAQPPTTQGACDDRYDA